MPRTQTNPPPGRMTGSAMATSTKAPSTSRLSCSASKKHDGSKSSTMPRSRLKRLSTRPTGLVWKKLCV
eukprot:355562-Chlamydomonas_euryale.AAC.3